MQTKFACYGTLKKSNNSTNKKQKASVSRRPNSLTRKPNEDDKKVLDVSGISKPIKQAASRPTNVGAGFKPPVPQRIWFNFGLPTAGTKPFLRQVLLSCFYLLAI